MNVLGETMEYTLEERIDAAEFTLDDLRERYANSSWAMGETYRQRIEAQKEHIAKLKAELEAQI